MEPFIRLTLQANRGKASNPKVGCVRLTLLLDQKRRMELRGQSAVSTTLADVHWRDLVFKGTGFFVIVNMSVRRDDV